MVYQLALPFCLALLLFSTNALFGLNAGAENAGTFNDLKKLVVNSAIYLLALVFFIKHSRQLWPVLKKLWPLLLFYLFAVSSMLWSAASFKVFINSGHYIGTLLLCVLMAQAWRLDPQRVEQLLILTFAASLALSLAACVLLPKVGTHFLTGRWQGLTGNPNTLGVLCFLAVWLVAARWFRVRRLFSLKLGFVLLVLSALALLGSKSMTSVLVSVGILSLFLFLAYLEGSSAVGRVAKVALLVLVLLFALAVVFINKPALFTVAGFLAAIGKDPTLTGRTDLWELAFSAIMLKPWAGWSFDSGVSIFSYLDFDRTSQFHNGYIEMFARGGLIGFALLTLILVDALRCFIKSPVHLYRPMGLVLVLVLATLVHNLTEASFSRETHLLWFFFVLAYCYAKACSLDAAPLDSQAAGANPLAAEGENARAPAVKFNFV